MVARSEGAVALIQTMLALRAEQRTGVLNVRAEGARTLIHFRGGSIVSAEDDEPPSPPSALLERARSAIVRTLTRDASSSEFDDLPERPQPPAPLVIDLESIVFEVMRALPRERASDVVLAGKDAQRVVLSGDPKVLASRFAMTAYELAFLEKIDGSKTVHDLVGGAAYEGDVSGVLAALVLLESVVIAPSVKVAQGKSEADQALLDGQIALSAGDDETAKKCFYEVLRLDPGSQAATDATHQVRLLARRGTTPPPTKTVAAVAPAIRVVEVAHAVAPASPVEAVEAFSERERKTAPGRRAEGLRSAQKTPSPMELPKSRSARAETTLRTQGPGAGLMAAVLVFGGAAAILATTQTSTTSLTAAPTPSFTHPPSPAMVARATAASAPPAPSAMKPIQPVVAPIASAETPMETDAGRTGTVQLPTYAKDRRVYVDGRLEQDGAATLLLPCGPHVIQIGSRGTPKSIAVLCGREIRLE